jgi:putative hydroxymethylpyrimidine transport system ATP-binding protein
MDSGKVVQPFDPDYSVLPGQPAPAIVLDGVSLSLGGRQLFHRLSLRFEGGRTTCLLGPSGCGKSTLLRLIAGIGPAPDAGRVVIDPDPGTCRCAWMGQEDLLLPWLTLRDNLLLGATLRGQRSEIMVRRADALLGRAGLAEAGEQLPGMLSGGMRQRGALLRTLLENRPIVLMDEPFSGLDALNRQRLQNLAATMICGKTVVMVTHDPLEALRLADAIIVLSGRPLRVAACLKPPGQPPRAVGGVDIARLHADLLALVMEDDLP